MTKPNDEKQLLRECPFCGEPGVITEFGHGLKEIGCPDACISKTFESEAEAIKHWNNRVQPSPRAGLSREQFRNIMCEHTPTIAEDSGLPTWSQGELDEAYDAIMSAQPKDDGLVEALEKVDVYFKACARAWESGDGKVFNSEGKTVVEADGLDELCEIAAEAVSKALSTHHEKRKL